MDRWHLTHFAVFVLAAAVAATGVASAVSLPVDEGFEGVAANTYPSADGWAKLYIGKTAKVVAGVYAEGNQSFKLDSYPWAPQMDYLLLDEVPDRLSYQVAVRLDPASGLAGLAGFMERYNGTAPMWNFFCVQPGAVSFCGLGKVDLGVAYAKGDWCVLRADLNYEDNTADLYVNGELKADDIEITPRQFEYSPLGTITPNKWGVVSDSTASFSNVVYFDSIAIYESDPTVTVQIDVKPGSDSNPINLGSNGLVPVCVFSSEDFDAATIDPATCDFAGAPSSDLDINPADIDGDGLADLVLHFETELLIPEQMQDGWAVLVGSTTDGLNFMGLDQVRLMVRSAPLRGRR